MKRNIGSADKMIRLFFAPILWVLYYTRSVTGIVGMVVLFFSIYFILSAVFSFCALYRLFRVSTFHAEDD